MNPLHERSQKGAHFSAEPQGYRELLDVLGRIWVPLLLSVAATLILLGRGGPAHAGKDDEDSGTQLYAKHCAICHGPEGRGDGLAPGPCPASPVRCAVFPPTTGRTTPPSTGSGRTSPTGSRPRARADSARTSTARPPPRSPRGRNRCGSACTMSRVQATYSAIALENAPGRVGST